MTELRRRMIQDMTLRGLRPKTQKTYVECIVLLGGFFRRSPGKLSGKDLRGWARHLTDRNLSSQRLRTAELHRPAKPCPGVHAWR